MISIKNLWFLFAFLSAGFVLSVPLDGLAAEDALFAIKSLAGFCAGATVVAVLEALGVFD